MTQKTYLALLRGINVGGNNIIKMVVLAAFFEERSRVRRAAGRHQTRSRR